MKQLFYSIFEALSRSIGLDCDVMIGTCRHGYRFSDGIPFEQLPFVSIVRTRDGFELCGLGLQVVASRLPVRPRA